MSAKNLQISELPALTVVIGRAKGANFNAYLSPDTLKKMDDKEVRLRGIHMPK